VAIVVTCGNCGASFQAKDADAGKKGRCPGCRGVIQVPSAAPTLTQAKPAHAKPANSKPSSATPATSRKSATSIPTVHSTPAEPIVTAAIVPEALPVSGIAAPAAPKAARAAAATARSVVGPAAPTQPAAARSTPGASPVAAATSQLSPQQLLGAFQGYIEPAPVHFGYRLGIVLVLLVMVLLPICYAALIFAVTGLVGLYAVYGTGLLTAVGTAGRRAGAMALLVYVAPLAAGAILVFFMIKPFFAKPAKRQNPRSLDRRGEPLLFAFVERVCDVVGAPYPTRIDIDCEVNASASFRRGVWSMFGDDLVLTIGLPLAAGLSLRQFAGVLAHEFGHFSQGTGMRLSYLVRRISFWFTRVVYERDAWDEQLVTLSKQLDIRLGLIVYLARGCIWATRKILWVFMMLGHLVSGFLLRQMEFDADRYMAQVAGSNALGGILRQLSVLSIATRGAYADLDEYRREGRLGDDLPRLIAANVDQLPEPLLEIIDKGIKEAKTGLFDTHPSDRDRIEFAVQQRAAGLFHVELPATLLFRDFAALSKTATFDFYREIFGKNFKLSDMHPVDQLLARQEKTKAEVKSLARYFQGACNGLRPLRLPGILPNEGADPRETLALLKQAREQMLLAAPAYRTAFEAYDKADTQKLEASQADAVLNARLKVKPQDFSQPMVNPRMVLQLLQGANYRLGQLSPQLDPLERWAEHRLLSALILLQVPKVAARVPSAPERLEESQRILAAYSVAAGQIYPVVELRNLFAVFMALASRLEGQRENATLMGMLERKLSELVRAVRDIQYALSMARYPFGHATAEPTLAEFIIPGQFHDADWNGVLSAASELLEGVPQLYARMLGRLVVLAEEVEAAFGLPQLPEPPPKPEPPPTA
jgi:Zn-dependent protease with chaperone function